MMNSSHCILTICLALSSIFPAAAQSVQDKQAFIAEHINALAGKAPYEMVYIQTSKDVYESGEDLWFKAYVLDARFLVPSLLSRTLYLRLSDSENATIFWQEKYEITDGFSNGHIYIDSELPEGEYFLAACTSHSLPAYPADFRAIRKIKIRKDILAPEQIETTSSAKREETGGWLRQKISVESPDTARIGFGLFPEGGHMVSGIRAKVAFKAVNYRGVPIDVSGMVYMDDTPILNIETSHAGMGSFTLVPETGKKYSVRLSDPVTDTTFFLPVVNDSGITMSLDQRSQESLILVISQSSELPAQQVYLRVQSRGVPCGTATGLLNGRLRIRLPLTGMPQGIAEITLLNSDLLPVAERLVYINPDSRLIINTEIKEASSTREKVTLKIVVRDEAGNPVSANLGVTVFDKIFSNPLDSNNISTYFHLTTQLKGRVYNPAFYFNNKNERRLEALDLLMLTQGWRSYVWNEIDLNDIPGAFEKVVNDEIDGELEVTSVGKQSAADQTMVMAFSPNKGEERIIILADSTGRFTLPPAFLKLWEGDYVYLKPYGPTGARFNIKLTDPFESIGSAMKGREIIVPLAGLMKIKPIPPLLFDYRVVKVPEATIKGEKTNAVRGKYMGMLDSLAKYSTEDYVCRHNILNCENHPGEADNRKPQEGEIYSVRSGSGAMSNIVYKFRTYTEEELLRMNNLWRVKAYYLTREFYQPDYDQTDDSYVPVPDFRNTLLWNPGVLTDEHGEATLEFFCSDINSIFDVRVEGVSYEGLIGTGYNRLSVRKLPPP
jgi:hypothetical protein